MSAADLEVSQVIFDDDNGRAGDAVLVSIRGLVQRAPAEFSFDLEVEYKPSFSLLVESLFVCHK
jgi:hypothetical protein